MPAAVVLKSRKIFLEDLAIGTGTQTVDVLGAGSVALTEINIPIISTGIVAPTSIPTDIGLMYINTAAGKVYVSTGTISSADWKILN